MLKISSYRRVFDLERRIYRVDRLRLNPGGVPVRGVLYFLAILAAALIWARLPLLSGLAAGVPWYLRDLALPSAGAAVLTMIRVEGRPFHLAAAALVRYAVSPHRLAGGRSCRRGHATTPGERWRPGEIVVMPDGSDSRMRRLRYTGPGAVLVAVAHERVERGRGPASGLGRGPALTLRELPAGPTPDSGQVMPAGPTPDRGQVIALARGSRILVRTR